MNADEGGLVLARACGVTPETLAVAQWRSLALEVLASDARYSHVAVCDAMFASTPYSPGQLCARTSMPQASTFGHAPGSFQLDLAREALVGIVREIGRADIAATTRLLIYATSSVDESYFRSTVSNLAVDLGISSVPHFSLGQCQGAALDLALDLIDATLAEVGTSALFVAAERWPLPYPRIWDSAPLADGAAAMMFVRGQHSGLRCLGSVQRGFAPFLSHSHDKDGRDEAHPRIDRDALVAAAAETILYLLETRDLAAADLDGWVACALDSAVDEQLRRRISVEEAHVIRPDSGHGDAFSASTPLLLAGLLEQVLAGNVQATGLWLSWNVSLGGMVGASLWEARPPKIIQ